MVSVLSRGKSEMVTVIYKSPQDLALSDRTFITLSFIHIASARQACLLTHPVQAKLVHWAIMVRLSCCSSSVASGKAVGRTDLDQVQVGPEGDSRVPYADLRTLFLQVPLLPWGGQKPKDHWSVHPHPTWSSHP